jgi:hypothetical protein
VKIIDRTLSALMFFGGIGHSFGSYMAYSKEPMTLLWAWSASLAMFLLASANLLRASRPGDRSLAWICLLGCLVQAGFVVGLGRLLGNMLDFRVVVNLIVSLGLAVLSATPLLKPGALRVRET